MLGVNARLVWLVCLKILHVLRKLGIVDNLQTTNLIKTGGDPLLHHQKLVIWYREFQVAPFNHLSIKGLT